MYWWRRSSWRSASGVKMTSTERHCGLRAARRDLIRLRTASARNALRGVGEVFAVARHHFLAEPALHGGIPFEQSAHALAHDFADRSIGAGLDLLLDGLGHIERQRDAELLGSSHKLRE